MLRGGIPWRMLPRVFPPRQTVWRWFAAWRDSGLFETINHHLLLRDRELAWLGRNRRLAKDFEATLASATALLYAASALLLTRRLGRDA